MIDGGGKQQATVQNNTWSKTPSSRACWSGLNLESVGGSLSFKPAVSSFKHIANLVMLYLYQTAVHQQQYTSTWVPCQHTGEQKIMLF